MASDASCPLDGMWCQNLCLLHAKHKANQTFDLCFYQGPCQTFRSLLENDQNSSTTLTKSVLVKGIPEGL